LNGCVVTSDVRRVVGITVTENQEHGNTDHGEANDHGNELTGRKERSPLRLRRPYRLRWSGDRSVLDSDSDSADRAFLSRFKCVRRHIN
jgi:hypothetical protein